MELNAALAAGRAFRPDPSIRTLLQIAAPLAEQSGYRFDPAIGGLSVLWGFHADEPPQGPPPDAAALRQWQAHKPSLADLSWQGEQVRSANPALQLDFGAFAKGYAVDRAIARLQAFGIRNAIVNAGGDLRAIGRHGARPWRIGIRHPRSPEVLASVEIRADEAVFTSGDYERFFEFQGTRYHHILDPFSGAPARGTTSVTVIDTDASRADAAATALFVAGPEHWHAVARAMGLRYVLLIDDAGVAHMNPAMAQRLHFEMESPPPVQLSEPLP
jgi:thiamine biosynthesis lipoprotein